MRDVRVCVCKMRAGTDRPTYMHVRAYLGERVESTAGYRAAGMTRRVTSRRRR